MENFYVSYTLTEGSIETHHYDELVRVKHIDDVESALKKQLMNNKGINPEDVEVYEVLPEVDYFDLKSWSELDIDRDWD